ncbi:hypothetical protein NQ315_015414 [Exocentrus adspersus]|uniref:Uncharacterized protein n=1 Tax=Exocentrus adspersus TaxID=1586481 RepID=A0AAV8VMY7_9CUCU|nr:hypothetical protein NQ315_015414 [Exocentrus adspersus]
MNLMNFTITFVAVFITSCENLCTALQGTESRAKAVRECDYLVYSKVKKVKSSLSSNRTLAVIVQDRDNETDSGVLQNDCKSQLVEESRKQKQSQEGKSLMERILPMMIIPFLVSTSMIPMMLITLKVMIVKSALIGKIGVLLLLLNMFRRRTNGEGGVFNHNVNEDDVVSQQYYGYYGDEEYGAYFNKRRKKRELGISSQ